MGHVLGLVKSYWPSTRLDTLGKGAKSDCTDEQFHQYVEETSVVANQIVYSQILLDLRMSLSWHVGREYCLDEY